MKKNELIELKNEAQRKIYRLQEDKKTEVASEMKLRHKPVIEQANAIENEIAKTAHEKFAPLLAPLEKEMQELEAKIRDMDIEKAKTLWYEHGSIVELWENPRYGNGMNKTGKKGTVIIYDGTQELKSGITSYSRPKIGDICVFHNKNNGEMGVRFDIIFEYGKEKSWHPKWFIDGETPTQNRFTPKPETEES